mmetsp:Transcript_63577/g.106051  ORF Transcript_63577/g.106051 Transcript_63577/m.106051 type:complete len:87 (+) Transcript_63577:1049-1309(+)
MDKAGLRLDLACQQASNPPNILPPLIQSPHFQRFWFHTAEKCAAEPLVISAKPTKIFPKGTVCRDCVAAATAVESLSNARSVGFGF